MFIHAGGHTTTEVTEEAENHMSLSLSFNSPPALPVIRTAAFLRSGRDAMIGAAIACLAAAVAHANIDLQDWIPDVLSIPSDAEVVTDRQVGSTVRLFSFQSGVDPSDLLADWEDELVTNGYAIQRERDELVENSIEFTGPGLANAKVVATPTADQDLTLFEFDATLQ